MRICEVAQNGKKYNDGWIGYNLGGYSHEKNLFSFQQRAGRSRS